MKTEKVKRMVGLSLLMALIVVLQMLGNFIHIGPVSISVVLVPIVIGAAVYGPSGGALLGATFSLMVTIYSINGMDAGGAMVFQASPVLCVLVIMGKGTLAGFAAGWVYRLLKDKNVYVAMLCAAIVCPLVNTGLFLICMYAFFMDILQIWAGGSDVAGYVISAFVLLNFLPELALNMIVSPAAQRIVKTVQKNI